MRSFMVSEERVHHSLPVHEIPHIEYMANHLLTHWPGYNSKLHVRSPTLTILKYKPVPGNLVKCQRKCNAQALILLIHLNFLRILYDV